MPQTSLGQLDTPFLASLERLESVSSDRAYGATGLLPHWPVGYRSPLRFPDPLPSRVIIRSHSSFLFPAGIREGTRHENHQGNRSVSHHERAVVARRPDRGGRAVGAGRCQARCGRLHPEPASGSAVRIRCVSARDVFAAEDVTGDEARIESDVVSAGCGNKGGGEGGARTG